MGKVRSVFPNQPILEQSLKAAVDRGVEWRRIAHILVRFNIIAHPCPAGIEVCVAKEVDAL